MIVLWGLPSGPYGEEESLTNQICAPRTRGKMDEYSVLKSDTEMRSAHAWKDGVYKLHAPWKDGDIPDQYK